MATDYFLKLDGVVGESEDVRHPQEIEIEAFSFEISSEQRMASHGGVGQASASSVTVHKHVDAASTDLMNLAFEGRQVDKAMLTCRKAGSGDQLEYLVITLGNVIVTHYSMASSGSGAAMESFNLDYARIAFTYRLQAGGGGSKGQKKASWDRQKNKAA